VSDCGQTGDGWKKLAGLRLDHKVGLEDLPDPKRQQVFLARLAADWKPQAPELFVVPDAPNTPARIEEARISSAPHPLSSEAFWMCCVLCRGEFKVGKEKAHAKMRSHIAATTSPRNKRVEILEEEIFPPGTKITRENMLSYYNRPSVRRWLNGDVDNSRVAAAINLDPIKVVTSHKIGRGYVAYVYPWTKAVMVECPVVGNATYILSGTWRSIIGKTKGELRLQYRNQVAIRVHKGDWFERVKAELRRHR
jgi:hypothetical protein